MIKMLTGYSVCKLQNPEQVVHTNIKPLQPRLALCYLSFDTGASLA